MSSLPEERVFRAVLFDIDGTLVDTIPMIVAGLGDAFEHFAGIRPSDSDLKGLIGTPLSSQMNRFGLDRLPTSTLHERVRFTMDRYLAHSDLIRQIPQAEDAYQRVVDAGIPTALVTSRNREELDWFLSVYPVFQRSPVAISCSEVTHPKPHAEPALLACERLGVKPYDACFVGDAIHDVECAQAAGVFSVAVSYGGASAADLRESNPNVLLRSPEALEEWIDQTILKRKPCFSTTQNESSPRRATRPLRHPVTQTKP